MQTPFVLSVDMQRTPKLGSLKMETEPVSASGFHLAATFNLALIKIYRSRQRYFLLYEEYCNLREKFQQKRHTSASKTSN
ncbi:MAG: hypothetical protein JWR72_3965 [Flavisolibacter sp.]|jgi:hypothetical protein|nr:hypothetical protein [Flavisolibacter sp.]